MLIQINVEVMKIAAPDKYCKDDGSGLSSETYITYFKEK